MKKIIALALACMMVLGMLTACGGGDKPAPTEGNKTEAPQGTQAPQEAKPDTIVVMARRR